MMTFASWLVDAFTWLIDGILNVLTVAFVPRQEFLTDMWDDIIFRYDTKFGGLRNMGAYLGDRFRGIRAYRDTNSMFVVVFPPGTFLHGIRMNLIGPAVDVLAFARVATTGFIVLTTAIICYRKVISFVSK